LIFFWLLYDYNEEDVFKKTEKENGTDKGGLEK
jgi:hypothetical protein